MNKFAFKNQEERQLVLSSMQQISPKHFYDAFVRFAQGVAMQPQVGQSSAASERLEQLKELLEDFIYEVGLGQDGNAIAWISKVVSNIAPVLTAHLGDTQSFSDQLGQVPKIQKNDPQPSNPINTPDPKMIDDIYHSRGSLVPSKPNTVPKDLKLTPNKKGPNLYRAEAQSTMTKQAFDFSQYDALANSLLDVADMADEAGLYDEADKVASILSAVKTVKVAQYEGFQNYWIANGRAFELAYRDKRAKGKGNDVSKFRSPHEVWFEILDEYQNSLLSNQSDFIAKYAKRDVSVLDRAASTILMEKMAAKINEGSAPGVAFYESINELGQGAHLVHVATKLDETLQSILNAAKEHGNEKLQTRVASLLKEAQWMDRLKRWFMRKFWDQNHGKSTEMLAGQLEGSLDQVIAQLDALNSKVQASATAGTPTYINEFYDIVGPIENELSQYAATLKLVGFRGTATLPHPNMVAGGPEKDQIDPPKLNQYIVYLKSFRKYISPDVGKKIDETLMQRGMTKGPQSDQNLNQLNPAGYRNPMGNGIAQPTNQNQNTQTNPTQNTQTNPTQNTQTNPTQNTQTNPTQNTQTNPTQNTQNTQKAPVLISPQSIDKTFENLFNGKDPEKKKKGLERIKSLSDLITKWTAQFSQLP